LTSQATQIYDLIAEEKFPAPVIRRFDSVYGPKAVHTQSNNSLEDIETERVAKARNGWQGTKERHERPKGEKSSGRPRHSAKNRSR
jgi:hypothetical protein